MFCTREDVAAGLLTDRLPANSKVAVPQHADLVEPTWAARDVAARSAARVRPHEPSPTEQLVFFDPATGESDEDDADEIRHRVDFAITLIR
jgi:hypothetical protein